MKFLLQITELSLSLYYTQKREISECQRLIKKGKFDHYFVKTFEFGYFVAGNLFILL